MPEIGRGQRGAALVEYVMILPMLLFLFLGTLEVFRLFSIKQSLRIGVKRALPCISHWKDVTYRREYDCENIATHIADELSRNPFAPQDDVRLTVTVDPANLDVEYGQLVRLTAVAEVKLGFIYFFPGRSTVTIAEYADTFMDASPAFLDFDPNVRFPLEPEGITPTPMPQPTPRP
jgi:Flp pilus assembly protein TadG